MQEYYFLFGAALIWTIFAVVQDFKTTEVSNWLNFSLIAFVLAYRGFYSAYTGNWMFFVYGLAGILLFIGLAYLFYYGRIFAGGDAKLLMGYGGILPYSSLLDVLIFGFGFIFLLFFIGSLYSLIYSLFLVRKSMNKFKKDFRESFANNKKLLYLSLIMIVLFSAFVFVIGDYYLFLFALLLVVFPLLYIYVKAIEKSCMVCFVSPKILMEGDWLDRDVKIGKGWIRQNVHGLSKREVEILKNAGKRVWIKRGIPFTLAFLLALLVFVWLWSIKLNLIWFW